MDAAQPAKLPVWKRLLVNSKGKGSVEDKNVARIRRRRAMVARLTSRLPIIKIALFIAGYLWMVIIPSPNLGRGTYIDENALQPGQVTTYWNWGDVHNADRYLEQLEQLRDTNSTSEQRAQYLVTEFTKLGIPAATQQYSFDSVAQMNGTNAYAVLSSPRSSGTEAMVISASWLSRTNEGDGTLNLRGVATVLALAKFLKRYSLWAKDLVFIISDGYLDGMQAWLTTYHGTSQPNLQADRIKLSSGVIWTALNIDYPGHSFSHLGIFHEGLNGRLPNQDLLNSFQRISKYTGGVPVVLYDHLDPRDFPERRNELDIIPSWVPDVVRDHPDVRAYAQQAKNVARHVKYQASGRGSGVHGLFHQFRIDAFTMFGLPATGPHGFHAIGRVVESTLRTTNNLLERLHASFFFYILTGPEQFIKIGSFLPSAVLISIAMMFGGLKVWVDCAWVVDDSPEPEKRQEGSALPASERWIRRQRPVLGVLGIMLTTHVLGILVFWLVTRGWLIQNSVTTPILFGVLFALPLLSLLAPPPQDTRRICSQSKLLKALNLCFASTVISITTVLNFSLAASMAVLLGVPLFISSSSQSLPTRVARYAVYGILAFGWIIADQEELRRSIWDWEVLGVWFAPFVCIMYTPLVLQAGLVCLLPS